jgi:hypothetical protein
MTRERKGRLPRSDGWLSDHTPPTCLYAFHRCLYCILGDFVNPSIISFIERLRCPDTAYTQ